MTRMSVRVISLVLAVALALLQLGDAQTYHYSNGWHAGKKRGDSRLERDGCSVRPRVLSLIVHILEGELSRIKQSCVLSSVSMGSLSGIIQHLGSPLSERVQDSVPEFD